MNKSSKADPAATVAEVVQTLVDVRASDTLYGDLYLHRARELLGTVLPQPQHEILKKIPAEIDAAVRRIRLATASQDWPTVESLARRVDELQVNAAEKGTLSTLGTVVYDTHGTSIDPFSPGFEFLPGFTTALAQRRDGLVGNFELLAHTDSPLARLYQSRAKFFAGLNSLSSDVARQPSSTTSVQELQQLAANAAERGDMSALRQYAQQLSLRQAKGETASDSKSDSTRSMPGRAASNCPMDLSEPFSDEVVRRAGALGLSPGRAEPPLQSRALYDFVTTRIWQPTVPDIGIANEGTIRAQALVDEIGFPSELSGPFKDLVSQFVQNAFVNSGGARYIPPFSAETVLVEDFPETKDAPGSELLSALGLERRRAVSRREIEIALLERGPTILQERL